MSDKILYCAECQNPLNGRYCEHCKFHPSLQDTYLSTPEIEASLKRRLTDLPEYPKSKPC